ncbi:MAG TPA: translation initiation factor IF-2 associated domain-containing protein, partial [Pseudoxanthomonas sp.]|nr:translation initiation factor IF-2 associated domain-containing protein [Pseudoxanthomonas sp.]
MTQQTTIRKLAALVNTPVEKLLEQLAEAGMSFSGPDQEVTSTEKMKLLGFLRRTHGKTEALAEDATAPKKITLNRRKVQEVTVAAGRSKTTVNVEVRQKRTYIKSDEPSVPAGPVSDERAEVLRKLEESRQRNLEEQQRLAETDRKRAEERDRVRQDEEAVRLKAEAERARADADVAAAATGVAPAGEEGAAARPAKAGHHVPKPAVRKDPPRA